MKQAYDAFLVKVNGLLFFLLTAYTFSLGQGTTPSTLPADFPKYPNTGNVQQDAANYDAQKKAWIATHTEEYIQMQPELSEEGKRSLRSNATKQEKQTRPIPNVQLPTDFPVLGNEKDATTFEERKVAWVQSHWENFLEMQPSQKEELFGKNFELPTSVVTEIKRMKREKEELLREQAVMTPEYREKLLWILEHEEEYRQNVDAEEANETIIRAKEVFNR